MSKPSHGPELQNRVQQLLEILIDCANSDLDENLRRQVRLDAWWEEENQANQKKYHLEVDTTLENLRVLFYSSAEVKKKTKETQRKYIGRLLTYYLGEFLGVLKDHRSDNKKRGFSQWHFILKLWSKDKTQNLRKFEQEWRSKLGRDCSTSSPDSDPSLTISVSSSRSSRQTTVGLENIAAIPVWVGRDALINELKAKLLAPETAPKVLAIVGQGGIGKTSLAVKLLESLGVQLQPPSLTASCGYEKVLYFIPILKIIATT